MHTTPRRIFDASPSSWKELQSYVAQVFAEIGCRVAIEKSMEVPRGSINVDVIVRDITVIPHALYVCECKYWKKRVTKSEIHAFRTVISELGANRGFLISKQGFQSGAVEAAEFTNIDLLTWEQFEALLFDRWVEGVTKQLLPVFAEPYLLMDSSNDSLWKMRECTEASWLELERISNRYQLISIWGLYHYHSLAGLLQIPGLGLVNESCAASGSPAETLDTYRKIVDAAPEMCRLALRELRAFWGLSK